MLLNIIEPPFLAVYQDYRLYNLKAFRARPFNRFDEGLAAQEVNQFWFHRVVSRNFFPLRPEKVKLFSAFTICLVDGIIKKAPT
jgi:hypothetical protein